MIKALENLVIQSSQLRIAHKLWVGNLTVDLKYEYLCFMNTLCLETRELKVYI